MLQVDVLARLSTSVVHHELVLLLVRHHHIIRIDLVSILSYLFEAIADPILTLVNLHVS